MRNMKALILAAVIVFAAFPLNGECAETVHLYLTANGQPIKGDSTQKSLGRQDSIECVYYEQAMATAREAGAAMTTGRRQYAPLLIRKRIDKSSPLLMKAFAENQKIEAIFRFFRPNPVGDGTTEQFYTVTIKNARVASLKEYVPDTIVQESSQRPPLEDVTFVFQSIQWTFTNGNVTYTDGGADRK